jgi:tRNA 2-thiouridine synthesizing protein E
MALQVGEHTIEIDEEGYLVEPADWNQAVAEELAKQEDLSLADEHWKIFAFMRESYAQKRIIPDVRHVIKYMAEEMDMGRGARNQLFKLFPYGYVKQACKIAGMRRPRAWSTG